VPPIRDSLSRRRFFAFSATATAGIALTPRQRREIDAETLAEAQKVFGLEFSKDELELMTRSLDRQSRGLAALRAGRELPNGLGPAAAFDPRLPAFEAVDRGEGFSAHAPAAVPLPEDDEDIAFAPVWRLAQWIESRALSSERLTSIYRKRLEAQDPKLLCAVTILGDAALAEARRADAAIARGNYLGPLHGIPYGAKDLFDTAGVRTTWGAAPFADRVAESDAWVIRRMREAGAVLLCKTTLGALAMGDQWFGGRTRNPFRPDQGSSGSSAGSASATAAGLVGFALGTETLGSIVSPCMRCGTTGLRPTFGRVGRGGAMALCWSMDKVGPIVRAAEDSILVLRALLGTDPDDPCSTAEPLVYDAQWDTAGRRVGYRPEAFEGSGASDGDRACLEAARALGWELVEIEVPTDPMDGELRRILSVEAAAAFEKLTLTNEDDKLTAQRAGSWPNSFRQAWFTSAVDLMQAMRHRRRVCERMRDTMQGLDAILTPSYADNLLLLTNMTGHPALVIRSGFRGATPTGTTLLGHLYDEGMLVRLGRALEARLGVAERRPGV